MVLRQSFPSREVLMQTMQTSRICFRLCGEQADKGGTVPCQAARSGTRMFCVSSWWIRIAIGWVLDLPYPSDPNFHETHSPERIWLTWAFTKRELEQLRWGFGDSSVVPTVWGAHTIASSEYPSIQGFFVAAYLLGLVFMWFHRPICIHGSHISVSGCLEDHIRRWNRWTRQVSRGIVLPPSPWLLPVSKSTFKQKD